MAARRRPKLPSVDRVSRKGCLWVERFRPRKSNRVFLNTSKIDNAPRSLVEAMACGLCVVSTNVGGVSHLMRDGTEGLLVAPDDPREMAGAVRRILEEPALAAMLSRGGFEAARKHDWALVFPLWERLFHRILERTG